MVTRVPALRETQLKHQVQWATLGESHILYWEQTGESEHPSRVSFDTQNPCKLFHQLNTPIQGISNLSYGSTDPPWRTCLPSFFCFLTYAVLNNSTHPSYCQFLAFSHNESRGITAADA
jgi:hypothetical protein